MPASPSPSAAAGSKPAPNSGQPPIGGPRHSRRATWLALAILVLCGLTWQVTEQQRQAKEHSTNSGANTAPGIQTQPATLASNGTKNGQFLQAPPILPAQADTVASLTAALGDLEDFLRSAHSKNEITTALERFRTRLMHAPRAVAVDAIYNYMSSGHNASTTLGFDIGPGGWLKNAPSLRTFLLDALGEVDPQSAADYAKVILEQNDVSPDEWSLSLRNLSEHDPDMATDPYLREKTRELVTNQQWLSQPSQGLLEGFDFVVFTKQSDLAPMLAGYMTDSNQNPAVRFASYLTLDRLMMGSPAAVMDLMNQQSQMLASAPSYRAGIYARADVTDPDQLAAVESYLQRPDVTSTEVSQFANAFPLFSQGVGDNLATTQTLPTLQQIAQRDVATLAVVNQWLNDPRFAGRQSELQQMQTNLMQNVENARQGGLLPQAP